MYERSVPDLSAFVDEVANELSTWPGVRIERRADSAATVSSEYSELGVLCPDRGVAELPVREREHDVLIEHGDADAVKPPLQSGCRYSGGIHCPPTHVPFSPVGRSESRCSCAP